MKKVLLIALMASVFAFVPVQRSDAQIYVGIPGAVGVGIGYPGGYSYGYPRYYGYYPYSYYRSYPYRTYYYGGPSYYWYNSPLVAAFTKEVLQDCRALLLQNARGDVAPVI